MLPISQAITNAFQAYQAGKLFEAEWICQEIVQQQPDYVPALHLLGAIAQQTHRLESAIACYRQVIQLEPDHFEAHGNLGVAFQEQGDWQTAEQHLRRSLELNVNHALTHFNLGNLLLRRGALEEAIACFASAITLKPDYARAHNNLGNVFQKQGHIDRAIACYQTAIVHAPGDVSAYINLGNLLQEQNRLPDAIAYYQQAIALNPHHAETYYNLGNALKSLGHFAAAITAYRQALTLTPDQANIHNNLGIALQYNNQADAALAHLQQAVTLKPDYAEAHSNLGILLQEQQHLSSAIAHYRQAILVESQFAQAHANLGMALLASGEFQEGWAEYEWRWYCEQGQPRSLPQTAWDGSDLRGKKILLYAEQGMGDSVQFIRYAPLLAQLGGQVLVECQSELIELFKTVAGIDQLIPRGAPLPEFDVHAPFMSLPHLMATTLSTVPAHVPYLSPPESFIIPKLELTSKLRVGVVWASGYRQDYRLFRLYQMRSCPLPILLKLQSLPAVQLYSLQVGRNRADLEQYNTCQIVDLSPNLKDFADTAAAIAQLDLIISVDTAVAHLAGALGKPTWLLLPFSPDWRWLLHRSDSPWYPTMRLFRQSSPGDWHGVMNSVLDALQELTAINLKQ